MDNYTFLENAKHTYESLAYFHITDNLLTLEFNGTFKIRLQNVSLSSLNPNLFLIHPTEIFQIIYVLELLYKDELTESEINFIESYTNKYLKLSNDALDTETTNTNRLWCLSIPIYTSYSPDFENKKASLLIKSLLNKQTEAIESGKSLHPKLVLMKDGTNLEEEEIDSSFAQAGFTTLFLILGATIATVLYITYFIIS